MIPFFSILIPSYNRPEYIFNLVESVTKSSFDNYEIIISDDCSPKQHEIKNVLFPFLKKDKRIKFYEQEKNIGEVETKNFLISKASGLYNIIIGDDDIFVDDALNKLNKIIINNPDNDVYTFGYSTIDEQGKKISTYTSPKNIIFSLDNFNLSSNILYSDMLPLWIFHPSTFCCKSGIEKSIGYNNNVGMAEDMFFLFELLLQGKRIYVSSDEIFQWRKILYKSKSSQLNQSSEYLADITARIKIYERLLKEEKYRGFKQFFESQNFIRRFLFKSVISDKRINLDSFYDVLVRDIKCSNKNVLMLFKDEINKPNYIKKINKIILFPERLVTFIKIFGFKSAFIFFLRIFSLRKILYKISQ